jgi:hypothetical protein
MMMKAADACKVSIYRVGKFLEKALAVLREKRSI